MKVISILLVDDDEVEALDINRTFKKMNLVYRLSVAKNGEEGLSFLQTERENGSDLPDLVLIDMNMPRMNGLEFLSELRNHPVYQHLKCFILTTTEEKADKKAAERLGISGFIVKPLKLNNPSSLDAFNLMIDLMNMKN